MRFTMKGQPTQHQDAYLSESDECEHRFLVIMYYANGPIQIIRVEADCYSDAVRIVCPGNDVVKVEVVAS